MPLSIKANNIQRISNLLFLFLCFPMLTFGASETKQSMTEIIDQVFTLAKNQYIPLAEITYKLEGQIPRTTDKEGKLINSDIKWWTSGFFPGTLWYIYEYTKDKTVLDFAQKFSKRIESEKFTTNNHDVGFMFYCSYGNGLRLTHDKTYPEVLLTASNSLLTRYRPEIKSIQSWEKDNTLNCPVIIDNMMNLEMLFWASKYSKNPKYKEVAINHANTTMKNQFRIDNSSYHVVDYDLTNGKVIKKQTNQGYSDESAWSRGQAWGLYGFTFCYRETKNILYLMQAQKIAKYILNSPNLPKDKVPYWDYNDPKIPNANRDASSAAITASSLIELTAYVDKKDAMVYKQTAEVILRSLASSEYLAKLNTNGRFLLKHNVGNMPKNSEIDVPLSYADYYFLEALLKFKAKFLK